MSRVSWSLCFTSFLLYIYVVTTFHILIGDVAVGLALIGLLLQKEPFRFPPVVLLFAVLLLWSALGIVTTRWPEVVQEELATMAKLGLILVVAANALRSRSQLRFFIIFWLACYALFPVRGTYINYFIGEYSHFGRAIWNYTYANANDLAAMSLLMLGLAVSVMVTERKGWPRHAARIGVVVLTLLVFMTQSRAGILGLAVFGVCAFIGNRRRSQMIVLGAVTMIVVGAFAPTEVWERLGGLRKATSVERLAEVDPEGSAVQRYQIWQTSWKVIADHPVWGVGLGAYGEANFQYSPTLGRVDTHSTYFNVLAEIGIPGFLLFMGVVFGTIVSAERVRRRCRKDLPRAAQQLYFVEIGLLGYMVSGIWGSYSRLNFLYLFLVLLYVLARVCESDRRALRRMTADHEGRPLAKEA